MPITSVKKKDSKKTLDQQHQQLYCLVTDCLLPTLGILKYSCLLRWIRDMESWRSSSSFTSILRQITQTEQDIDGVDFIILASDGLWNVISNKDEFERLKAKVVEQHGASLSAIETEVENPIEEPSTTIN